MSIEDLCALLEANCLDGQAHGVAADELRRDPQRWNERVAEWGVSMTPVRSTPAAAQQDAARFQKAVLELGYDEQRGVEVNAHALLDGTDSVVGWRGCVNLTWFSFASPREAPATTGSSVPYQVTEPTE